jgi:hypothetical protein
MKAAQSGSFFCPECGSTAFYRLDAIADVVAVPVGAFADPDFPQPRLSVYGVRKHSRIQLPDYIERLD